MAIELWRRSSVCFAKALLRVSQLTPACHHIHRQVRSSFETTCGHIGRTTPPTTPAEPVPLVVARCNTFALGPLQRELKFSKVLWCAVVMFAPESEQAL